MIKWYGKEVQEKVILSARKAMDIVMSKCVIQAKGDVPVVTATYQGSIRMEPTKEESGDLIGRWGSYNVLYAIFVELGTIHMAAQPALRPAADRYYPTLPAEIRRAMA